MGIIEIAPIATALLVEFFKSAISETAKKSIESLFGVIKAKLSTTQDGQKVIDAFRKSPSDNNKQIIFEEQLKKQMLEDKDFAQSVEEELRPIIHNKEISIFLNKIDKVNKIIQINNMYGDIEM